MKSLLKRIWPVGLLLALCMLVLPSTMLAAEQKNDVYVNGIDTVGMARAANEDTVVAYPVTGGNIYFDTSTGMIIGCEEYGEGITEIIIPTQINGVSVIGIDDMAFNGCFRLTSIVIPEGITTIGSFVFDNCYSLTKINIPDSVNQIKYGAFSNSSICNVIVTQSNGYYYSDDGILFNKNKTELLHYNKPQSTYAIPSTVKKIGEYAFDGCSQIVDIIVSENVSTIGQWAFTDCNNLNNIFVNDNNKNFSDENGVLFDKDKKTLIFYPAGKKETHIVIPDGVVNIENEAFFDCANVKYLTIPDSVKKIGEYVFGDLISLKFVYYLGCGEQWSEIFIADGNEAITGCPGISAEHSGDVLHLTDWNKTNKQLIFNYNQIYNITDQTKISGANSIDELINHYVLIKSDINDEQCITRIEIVDSDFGVLSDINSGVGYLKIVEFVFDNVYHQICELLDYRESLVGKSLLYHEVDGRIYSYEVLQDKTGILENYDSSTNKLTIAGVEYIVSNLTNISADDINNLLQKNVKIQYDQLNHLYAIESFNENITPVPSVDGFNLDLYRAQYLADKSKNVSAYEYIDMKTPCFEFVFALQQTGFDKSVTAWKSFDLISSYIDDPTALYDFVAEPQDMYSAILLSLLEDAISYDIIDAQFETYCKNTDKYISNIQNIIKAKYNIDICNNDDFNNLNAEQKKLFYDTVTELYEKDFGNSIGFVSSIFDGLTKGIEFVGNIEDYFERINTCLVVANTNEYMKQVLQEVYNESLRSGNIYLQLATMDCLEVVTLSQDELFTKLVFDGLTAIGEESAKYVISDVVWPQIKTSIYASHPAVLVFQTAYKGSKFVSNLLFSTDKTYEAYLNMLVMNDIIEVVDNAFCSLRQKFIDNGTIQNANVLANAFDLAYIARDIDCQKAWQLVDVLDNTTVNTLLKLLGYNNFANAKEFCRSYQQEYYTVHKDALFGWVRYLYDDYPDSGLYEYYDKIYEEIVNKKCTKEFVAKCPIDVYVYDENNNIVAYIEKGKVSGNDQIMLALVDDAKIIRFFDDINYRIEYVATDSGEMDITISEFDLNEDKVRTVNFYNVNLTDGQSYCFDVDNRILNDRPYELNISSTDEVVAYDFDSLLSSANEYNVSIQQGTLIDNGESFLNKKAKKNESFELYAYVPDGYSFVCWEASNGADIFEDKTASTTSFIMPEENIIIKAVIKANNISLQPVSSITLNKNTITLNSLGSKETLLATVLPENATNKSVTWSSDNTSVATVDENGVVIAVGNGTAKITATTIDGGYKAVCEVKVSVSSSTGGNSGSHSGGGSSSAANKTVNNNISVSNIAGGGIGITPKNPSKGDIVTLNIVPDNGYELEQIKVTDFSGNKIKLNKVKENKYTFIMPDSKVKLDATFKKIATTKVEETKVMPFTDVKAGDWFYNAVKFAYENSLMNGETDILFMPNNNLNRAMLVTILYRLENTSTISEVNKFSDVAIGQWYANAVVWASANGIVNGYEDGTFLPMQNVSREEMAAMLMRYAKYKGYDVSKSADLTGYVDGNKVSAWAVPNMQWASGSGLIKGDESNKLNPQGNATRAEAAMILMRFIENISK